MQKNLKNIFGSDHGLDPKSVEYLTKALSKNNLPGFDYLEFKQSLAALLEMGMDEATAIKSTYATGSTVGLSKEKLLKTAAHYRKILATEKMQFDEALKGQLNKRVNGKKEEVEKRKVQIQKWKDQMQLLQQKIDESQTIIDNADEHIKAEMDKINNTRESFEFAHQSIDNQINKDIENIDLHL